MGVIQRDFHTVITGAGISFEAPSNLPSGEQLAAACWEVLAETVGLPDELVDVVAGRIMERKLRLEQLLDVMTFGGHGMPLHALVTAYLAVESDAFNPNHERLSYLQGVRHFTVNMDTLLESAAETRRWDLDIIHLHGRWDHPSEISTTISQYLAALDPGVEREFGDALSAKSVLVAGYSARDRDIQPLFLKYPPASLTWLVYPRAGANPTDPLAARKEELEPEAIRLLDTLRNAGRTTVSEVRTTISEFLPEPPAALDEADRTPFSRGINGARGPLMKEFTGVEEWRRRLAIAAVLGDQGFGGELDAVLDPLQIPTRSHDAKVAAAKLRARALRRQGRRGKAIVTLLTPVGRGSYSEQLRAVANEASATLPGTRLHWLADPIDRVLAAKAEDRTEFLIRTRTAQRQAARGELYRADEGFRELSQRYSKDQVGLGNWVNLLTWHADVLKVLGRVGDARRLLEDDLDETFYSDQAQSAALEWKLLELALVTGGPGPAVVHDLLALTERGPEAIGINQHCWLQLTLLGATGRLESSLESTASRRADTEMFFHLQRAEVVRASGDLSQAQRWAHQALRVELDRGRWQGSRTGRLAARLILKTIEAQRTPGPAAADLEKIARAYERLGARLPAAHARLNAALASNRAVSDELVLEWSASGWIEQAQRARNSHASLADRWQIVM